MTHEVFTEIRPEHRPVVLEGKKVWSTPYTLAASRKFVHTRTPHC